MNARLVMVLAGLLAAPAGSAAAQRPAGWIAAPNLAEVAAAYPQRARLARRAGAAELTCGVNFDGWLRDCAVLAEQPAGEGFGIAARRLAERFRTVRTSSLANGADVRLRIAFRPEMLQPGSFVVQTPAWAALPSAADFQATFPKIANDVNEVRVVMTCSVAAGGALSACAVEREDPAGQGYGAGALALAPKIRVGLWTPDGLPTVGARVRVPIRYELRPAPAAATP
ncbi:MAG TPA: hypothetical protein VLI41_12650 [Phenylobacterium sp.]|uniref:hypothetical protein n=1 Tax=Phenylobacterium sp. TaxID=1871053 RepID=UPI002B8AB5E4|nr:hypothetical protein [Phenylobacterium sp.]HSV04045.1 hypothetical protein [Phenylobacterium sp.]